MRTEGCSDTTDRHEPFGSKKSLDIRSPPSNLLNMIIIVGCVFYDCKGAMVNRIIL